MKEKEIITPASTSYTVEIISSFASISTPYATLEKAKAELKKQLNDLSDWGVICYEWRIVKRTWKAWCKDEPSPKPTEKVILEEKRKSESHAN